MSHVTCVVLNALIAMECANPQLSTRSTATRCDNGGAEPEEHVIMARPEDASGIIVSIAIGRLYCEAHLRCDNNQSKVPRLGRSLGLTRRCKRKM